MSVQVCQQCMTVLCPCVLLDINGKDSRTYRWVVGPRLQAIEAVGFLTALGKRNQPILSRLVEVSSFCLVCIVCGFWITRPKQEVAVLLPQQPVALWSRLGGVSLPGFSITFCGREGGWAPRAARAKAAGVRAAGATYRTVAMEPSGYTKCVCRSKPFVVI